ncbi:glycosyltransferase [Kocuria coralli]|uniref:Glycosyltransferase n=1 Tax=Kocuria coralli TaxID=1461025 RepID=A0A5J5KYI9_9MICC|nr:nucleotide disphospho-sugar-binding domain-containing protein [Kocuria coralli]KAA9394498.1 glycosyltransferase [Kocuria coralli]
MTSVLITSTPVRGHITPLLSIAEALVAAGDRVRFLTGGRYQREVLATGADFLPLPPEADYDDRDLDTACPGRRGRSGPAGIRYDMIEIFLKPVPAQLRAVREALGSEPTDVILAETMFAAASVLADLPRSQRPLIASLGIVPLAFKHPDVAPYGLGIRPLPGPLGRLRNAALTVAAERGVFAPVQRFADDLTREVTGRPMQRFFLDWPAGCDLLVQFTVAEFEYPRAGLPDHVRFVGTVSRSAASTIPLPDWWRDLDGRRVVHVTQGTVANTEWGLIGTALEALADDDVLVVVSTGGRPVDTLPPRLPGNARVARFLPYDWLLPRTDVLVTNGGYGGVHHALEHGVPIVTAGRTEEKAEVGARVSWSGAGIDLRTDRPSPRRLRRAVRAALDEPRYRARSAAIGAAIGRSPGPGALHGILAEALDADASTAEHI